MASPQCLKYYVRMVRLLFRAQDTNFDNLLLLGKHNRLWNQYGQSIIGGFEQITGLSFTQGIRIDVTIADESKEESHSGVTNREAIKLVYSSPNINDNQILWLLCHELGHRLLGQHKIYLHDTRNAQQKRINNYNTHRALFVILIELINLLFSSDIARWLLDYASKKYQNASDEWDETYQKSWQWAYDLSPAHRRNLIETITEAKTLILPEN